MKDCGTDENKGRFQEYETGRIYSSSGGAHEVHGAILTKWIALGGETSFLGFPATDERWVSDGKGHYSEFAGGVIYWSPVTGAHAVIGAILGKWRVLRGPRGVLGYPTSDETPTPYNDARFNTFERGSVYWSGGTGACAVHGEIHDKWIAQGGAAGSFGLPISDELPIPSLICGSIGFRTARSSER